jgi:hypothetical protein
MPIFYSWIGCSNLAGGAGADGGIASIEDQDQSGFMFQLPTIPALI